MKRWMLWAFTALLAVSCNLAPVARISATIENAKDSAVVLQKLNYNRLLVVDTIRTDASGHFNYKVKLKGNEPYFYYLYVGGRPVASMILLPSDQVTVNVPAEGPFTIEGSEESELFQQVNTSFSTVSARMNELLATLDDDAPESRVKDVNQRLSKMYVDYKRDAIKYVITHPRSITSAVVLFQRFNDNLPVFGQESDAVIFKTVRDSLVEVYPRSEFVTALRDEVDARTSQMSLSRFDDIALISFPEIELPDMEGVSRKLSDLEGKVIVLSFWSVGQTEHKLFNVDLVDLYGKYHERGLEIYQVSLDIDKPSWASTVRSQNLPWISVSDGLGVQSPAVTTYNVDHVPSMFVINREGDIVGTDVFDKEALEQLIRKSL